MEQQTPWQLRSDEVLAVLLQDENAFSRVKFEWGLLAEHFPVGPHRELFQAIQAMRFAREPMHITAVHEKCSGRVSLEWIGQRYILYSEALGGEIFRDNVKGIQRYGDTEANLTTLNWAITELKNAKDDAARSEILGAVITNLGLDLHSEVADATAASAGQRFEDLMSSPPGKVIKSNIPFIDNATGGFQPEQIWWIVGAYKSLKSTLMRNIALNIARDGGSVTIGTLEGSQSTVNAQFVTMLAAEWLFKNGLFNEKDKHGLPLNELSSALLLRLKGNYVKVLDKRQVEAIKYGVKAFKEIGDRLRIYDTTPQNGGLGDISTIQTMIMRDRAMYGADVVMVDYLQAISGGGAALLDRVSNHALKMQAMALKNKVSLVVLAQRNEETIKNGGDNYSPGVKGGGDPAATADFLFVMGHEHGVDDTTARSTMHVQLKLARYAAAGKKEDFPIHPASGLLLPTDTLDLSKY